MDIGAFKSLLTSSNTKDDQTYIFNGDKHIQARLNVK